MPQPSKIPLAFAASGDKNTIPESTETTGLASWRGGFPAITSAPFSEGGIAPKRADFNGIFYALSQAVMWMQQGGVYAYDVNTDYEAGNVVLDAGGLYVANAANGPSSAVVQPSTDTTGATWKLVRLDLATQSAAGYMSATDKAALDNVPSTYLPLAGGQMSGNITKNALDSILYLSGGRGWKLAENGARLALYGRDEPTNPGAFFLGAGSAQGEKSLVGSPDGTLTWGGYELAPKPLSPSGVGQWTRFFTNSKSVPLPSGGTWAYFVVGLNSTNGVTDVQASVAAGGTTIMNQSSVVRVYGFCWRIA